MANGVISLPSTKSNLEGRIVWESTNNGATANTSNVVASIQVRRNDGYTTKGTWEGQLTIADSTEAFSNSSTSVGSDWVTMKQFTKWNVAHNNDGSGTCWIAGWCNAPSGTSLSGQYVDGGGTVTLDKIARYLNITAFEIRNITINTIQVYWATDVARNSTHYYLNNGAGIGSATYGETVASDGRSGTFNVKGLNPNTNYSIKIDCTRSDNGLVTTTDNKSFSTYNIATINQAPNFNIGENPTITWSNPGGCTTIAYAENIVNGNPESVLSGEVNVTNQNSYTYQLNASTLYGKVPNSNSGIIRYVIRSSNDGKNYWSTVDRTYYVTNSNPIFSDFSFKDTNNTTVALTGSNQKFIRGYSNLQATISTANKAVAQNYASMKNYTLTVGTKNSGEVAYSNSANVDLSVSSIDNNIVFVTAKDSRQNTTAVQKVISDENYYTYNDLTITKCTLTRSEGGVGTQVTLNYEGYIWNNSFGNKQNSIKSVSYEYKVAGTNDWKVGTTELSPNVSGNTYSQAILIQGDLAGSGFNDQNSYDFRLTVTDELTTKQFTITFGAGKPLVAYHKNGMAIGKKYDTSDDSVLQVSGDISINGKKVGTGSGDNIVGGVPVGGIVEYPSNKNIPDGWLECDGSVVSRTTYSALFAKIGTEFGEGDGSTTFGLPNMKGKVSVGLDTSDNDFNVIGKTGGEKTHRLTEPEMPTHWHKTAIDFGGTESIDNYSGYGYNNTSRYYNNTNTAGGDKPHNNLQPYFVTKFIIKAEESSAVVATVVDNLTSTSSTNALSANQGKVLNNKIVNLTTVVLYSNDSGTDGSFTLSDSAEKYSRFEIYFRDQEGQHSGIVVYNPNGKRVNLDMTVTNSGVVGSWAKIKAITINGANVNVDWYCEASITDSSVHKNNYIFVTKVMGFLN